MGVLERERQAINMQDKPNGSARKRDSYELPYLASDNCSFFSLLDSIYFVSFLGRRLNNCLLRF